MSLILQAVAVYGSGLQKHKAGYLQLIHKYVEYVTRRLSGFHQSKGKVANNFKKYATCTLYQANASVRAFRNAQRQKVENEKMVLESDP